LAEVVDAVGVDGGGHDSLSFSVGRYRIDRVGVSITEKRRGHTSPFQKIFLGSFP
jgi:hypothetical protein